MIEYDVLCQAIASWKAGQAPPASEPAAAEEVLEELDSGLVEFGEVVTELETTETVDEYEVPGEPESSAASGEYAEAQSPDASGEYAEPAAAGSGEFQEEEPVEYAEPASDDYDETEPAPDEPDPV